MAHATPKLHVEPRPLFLHLALPFPFLATLPLDTAIDSPQLEREARTQLLQTGLDVLDALHHLAVSAHDRLLGRALLAENVAVLAEEYVVALVVQGDDSAAFDLWGCGPKGFEEVGRQETEGCAEVVEDEFWESLVVVF